jgi:hypothetical protein
MFRHLFHERRYVWRDVKIAYILARLWLFRVKTAVAIWFCGRRSWLVIWRDLDNTPHEALDDFQRFVERDTSTQ